MIARVLNPSEMGSEAVLLLLEVLWMGARGRFEALSRSEGSDLLLGRRSCCTRHVRHWFAATGEVFSSGVRCGGATVLDIAP